MKVHSMENVTWTWYINGCDCSVNDTAYPADDLTRSSVPRWLHARYTTLEFGKMGSFVNAISVHELIFPEENYRDPLPPGAIPKVRTTRDMAEVETGSKGRAS